MNLLAIVGSPRKSKATDTLIDKAIDGVKSKNLNCSIKKIYLVDHKIKFCTDCLTCWKDIESEPYAKIYYKR